MNLLPSLSALVVYCFLYTRLASCKPLESITEDKLNEGLLQLDEKSYQLFLIHGIVAASSGKNLFSTSHSLSEDCSRTAKVIMQSFEKPSTTKWIRDVMVGSVSEASPYRMNNTFQSVLEIVCKRMNEKVNKWPTTCASFEQLKKAVQLSKAEKNFIFEVPANQNVTEWLSNATAPYDDAEFVKFGIMAELRFIHNTTFVDVNQRDLLIATSEAIDELARTVPFTSTVDKVFTDTLDKDVKIAQDLFAIKHVTVSLELMGVIFVEDLNVYFSKNDLLKEEYSKKKKKVLDLEISLREFRELIDSKMQRLQV